MEDVVLSTPIGVLLTDRPPLLDAATRSTAGFRLWSIMAGPLNALLVGFCLSASAQGLYYSFGSMAQLVIYLELGLGFALQQLVSHEFAHLRHGPNGEAEGDPAALDRLRGLMRWALKWYGAIALTTLLLLPAGGYLFLSQIEDIHHLGWEWPWFVLSIWVGIAMIWVPCWPLLEGSDLVSPLYRFRLRQGIVSRVGSWFTLGTGQGLFAPFVDRFLLGTQALWWLRRKHGQLLRSVFQKPSQPLQRWSATIWPLQWRMALSTAGGFTAFAIFIPSLLWAQGAVEAGRLGMTFALINAAYSVSHGLVQARQPALAMAAARGEFNQLHALFTSRFQWAMGLYALGCCALIMLLTLGLSYIDGLNERLLDVHQTTLLAFAMGIRLSRDFLNLYGRSFKQEPFFQLELIQGLMCLIVLPWMAIEGGATGMLFAWLGINLILLGPHIYYFRNFRDVRTHQMSVPGNQSTPP